MLGKTQQPTSQTFSQLSAELQTTLNSQAGRDTTLAQMIKDDSELSVREYLARDGFEGEVTEERLQQVPEELRKLESSNPQPSELNSTSTSPQESQSSESSTPMADEISV